MISDDIDNGGRFYNENFVIGRLTNTGSFSNNGRVVGPVENVGTFVNEGSVTADARHARDNAVRGVATCRF